MMRRERDPDRGDALRETEERARLALDAAELGSFIWYPDEDRGEPDARMLALFGLPATGTLNLRDALATLIHPGDSARYAAGVTRSLDPASGGELREEIRVIHPDGAERWVAITSRVVFEGEPPRPVRMIGVAADVTERKLADAARRAGEERLRRMVNIDGVGVLVFDATGTLVDANETFLEMTGRTRQAVDARELTWRTMTPAEYLAASEAQMEVLGRTGRIGPYEKEYLRADGSRSWMLFAGAALGDGTVVEYCIDVSARHRAEAALVASEARHRALATASADVLYRMSPDWSEMRQLDGRDFLSDTPEPSDTWLSRYIHPDDQPQVTAAISAAIREKRVFQLEHRVVRADGTLGWTFSRAVPLLDADGAIVEWIGAASDVTARRDAEAALRESEAKYRAVFESINEGFSLLDIQFDADGRAVDVVIRDANPAQDRIDGIRALIGRRVREILPDIEQKWIERYADVARTGAPIAFENWSDANRRWYAVNASRVGGEGSTLVAIVYDDITTRKQTEAALRASEERQTFLLALSDALRPLADPILVQDTAVRTLGEALRVDRCYYAEIDWMRQAVVVNQEYLGAASYSLVGEHPLALFETVVGLGAAGEPVVCDDVATDPVLSSEASAYRERGVQAFAVTPLVKDGATAAFMCLTMERPRSWTAHEVRLLSEAAERTWAAVERARVEAALRESETRAAAMVAHLPGAAAFIVDHDLRYVVAGGEALEESGFTASVFLGRTLAEVLPPELVDEYVPRYRRALAGEPFVEEHTAHGRTWVTRGAPLCDRSGRVYAALAVSYDITELRAAEAATQAALATAQAARAEADAARREVEVRIAERTAELARANAQLRAGIAERTRAQEERNTLLRRLASAQEGERRHLARELHDEAGQHLTAIGLGLQSLTDVVPRGSEVDRRVDALRGLVDTLGRELHALAVQLRPRALDDFGLETAITAYSDTWSRQSGIPVVVHARVDAERLSPAVESTIYRIVQEALTNVARHAGATRAGVAVQRDDGHVVVTVEDDGQGFDTSAYTAADSAPRSAPPGLGLLGIRERATLLGGTVDVESSQDHGTTLLVRIPIDGVPDA